MAKFADLLGGRLTLFRGDVLLGEAPENTPAPAVITANPPYISSSVIDTLDVQVQMEPRTALDGGEDGMRYYRAILEGYLGHLAGGGCIIFEVGENQAQDVCDMFMAAGFESVAARKDTQGIDRVVIGKIS